MESTGDGTVPGRPVALDHWLEYVLAYGPGGTLIWPTDWAQDLARWVMQLERNSPMKKSELIELAEAVKRLEQLQAAEIKLKTLPRDKKLLLLSSSEWINLSLTVDELESVLASLRQSAERKLAEAGVFR